MTIVQRARVHLAALLRREQTDAFHAQAPYSGKGTRNTSQLLHTPTPDGSGYAAGLDTAVQL